MPAGSGSGARRVDLIGALTVTAGLGTAVYAVVRAPEVGWNSAETWVALAAAAVLLAGFVLSQAKGRNPLVRLGIFRAPEPRGRQPRPAPARCGVDPDVVLPEPVPAAGPRLHRVPQRCGAAPDDGADHARHGRPRPTGARSSRTEGRDGHRSGAARRRHGLARPSSTPTASYVVDVLPASLVAALGMSLAFIPTLGTAIGAARPEEGGLAAGIVNTSYQVGSALGLAVMTAIAAANGADQLGDTRPPSPTATRPRSSAPPSSPAPAPWPPSRCSAAAPPRSEKAPTWRTRPRRSPPESHRPERAGPTDRHHRSRVPGHVATDHRPTVGAASPRNLRGDAAPPSTKAPPVVAARHQCAMSTKRE